MKTALMKRIVAGTLAGVIGSALAVGTPLAQAPAKGAPAAAQPGGPAWLLGRWAPRCPGPQVTVFAPGEVVALGGDTPVFRAEVTYAVTADVVVMTIGQVMVGRLLSSGSTIVARRVGDRIQISSANNPSGDSLERCAG